MTKTKRKTDKQRSNNIQKTKDRPKRTPLKTGGDRATPWVPLVEQELLTLPDHTSSPPVYRVTLWYLHNFRTITKQKGKQTSNDLIIHRKQKIDQNELH
jgi:hypothetical protein